MGLYGCVQRRVEFGGTTAYFFSDFGLLRLGWNYAELCVSTTGLGSIMFLGWGQIQILLTALVKVTTGTGVS
jgi:hypothetical protein